MEAKKDEDDIIPKDKTQQTLKTPNQAQQAAQVDTDPLRIYGSQTGAQRNVYTSVGDVDLNPLAAAPGVNPFSGRSDLYGGMHPGGGMFVGPEHPMFTGGIGGPRLGGPGYPNRPTMGSVPPGARFDPVMPFGPGSTSPFGSVRPGIGRPGRGNWPPFRYLKINEW